MPTIAKNLKILARNIVFSPNFSGLGKTVGNKLLEMGQRVRFGNWYQRHKSDKLMMFGAKPGLFHNSLQRRSEFYQRLLDDEQLADCALDYLEFGVAEGASIRWWSGVLRNPGTRLVGFDTFTGLPEAWEGLSKGHFSTQGRTPEIDDARCAWEIGLVQNTLPGFIRKNALERRKIVHMDLDLYSASLYVLIQLSSCLRPGDIVMFDEFSTYMHEFRAFNDFLEACPISFELLCGTNDFYQVAFKVLDK